MPFLTLEDLDNFQGYLFREEGHSLQGGATLQLSWTTNPNLWALTLFFKLLAPYFNTTSVLGYIWICMRQISPKVPLSTCFLQK